MNILPFRGHRAVAALLTLLAASSLSGPAAAQIYVADAYADSVLVFDPAVAGAQAPLQEISVPANPIDLASSMSVDVGRHDEIVLTDRTPGAASLLDRAP